MLTFLLEKLGRVIRDQKSIRIPLLKLRLELIVNSDDRFHDHDYKGNATVLYGSYTEQIAYLSLKTNSDGTIMLPSEFTLICKDFVRQKGDTLSINFDTKHRVKKLLTPFVWILVKEIQHRKYPWGYWIEDDSGVQFTRYTSP